MKVKNDVIKADDRVRIKNPEFFVRCGYPKSLEVEKELVEKECKEEIDKFLNKFGFFEVSLTTDAYSDFYNIGVPYQDAYDKIVTALAYARIKRDGFGGDHREIYTEVKEEFEGREAYVN